MTAAPLPSSASVSPLLQAQALSLTLSARFTLGPCSFALQPGRCYGLLGANGAGKSTLLKLLAGLLTPASGELFLQGQPLALWSASQRARRIAYLSQQSTVADLPVFELLRLGLLPHKSPWHTDSAADQQRIEDALQAVGLSDKAQQRLTALSGGELQRAMLGRVLVQQADILLLDEPANHLDVHYQHQLLALLRQLGLTVLASFHDVNLAASYCDELLMLEQGQLIAAGPVRQVLEPALLSRLYRRPCQLLPSPFAGDTPVVYFQPETR